MKRAGALLTKVAIVLAAAATALSHYASASTPLSANYRITASSLNNGIGGMGSANYRLTSSVGDAIASLSLASANFRIASGYQAETTAAPEVVLSTASLVFPSTAVGSASAIQSVTVSNAGSASRALTAISPGGANPGDFVLGGTCTPSTILAPSSACSIDVTFSPAASGSRTATITVASDDTVNPTYVVNVSGTATDALPSAVTTTATAVTAAGATLNGTISANGTTTLVTFEYGTTTAYGGTIAATQSPLSASASSASVSAAVTGLACGTTYHFRVDATNAGDNAAGADSTFNTPACATAPGAPTIGTAAPGNGHASISFSAPASDGGSAITSYTVTCAPGHAASGSASPIVVTGLANGTTYTCSVTATNVMGTGSPSGTVSVTPVAGSMTQFAIITSQTTPNIALIDLATNTVVKTISIGAGTPGGVAANPAGGVAYVVVGASSGRAVTIDTSILDVSATTPLPAGAGGGTNIALSPDGARAYQAAASNNEVHVIDVATTTVITSIPVGSNPFGIAVNPSGTRVYVANTFSGSVSVIDTATNTVVDTIGGLPTQPLGLAIDPAGARVYVAEGLGQSVSVIDTATNTVVATLNQSSLGVPLFRPYGLAVSPNGSELYIVDNGGNVVQVVNTATLALVGSIGVGVKPSGISFDATGSEALVTNAASSTVSVIDTGMRSVTATIPVVSSPYSLGTFITSGPSLTSGTAPAITSPNSASFTVNSPGTFTVTATGSPAATLSVSGALPSGVTFTPGTGALAGTPALGTVGTYALAFTASNAVTPDAGQAFTLTIAKASQTITFTNPGAQNLSATSLSLSATATSGLGVSFSTTTHALCSVSGSSVTMLAAGTCVIDADQAGDGNYNAASTVQQSFVVTATVTSVPPAITSVDTVTFTVNAAAAPFTITATGTPTPAITQAGALPAGIAFTPGTSTATLSGAPALGSVGSYHLSITATGAAPAASQAFTLLIAKANQTVSFAGPGSSQSLGTGPIAVAATATSGLSVTFSSSTPTRCLITGTSVTLLGAGTCTINADQSGDGNYNGAPQVSQSFIVNAGRPGAPVIGVATPFPGSASIAFAAPASDGGSPVTGYTLTCNPGAIARLATSSPITVTGLNNGTAYTCSITATNAFGPGPASGLVGITPAAARIVSAPSATGSGTITAAVSGGGAGCSFATARFISVIGDPASPPPGTAPAGVLFPHGLFDFTTAGCTGGSTVTFTITYPSSLPPAMRYFKYGPRPGPLPAAWYAVPATVTGNSITFDITDGGLGDDDLAANGLVADPGGPGVGGDPNAIPTLSEWAMIILAMLLLAIGLRRARPDGVGCAE